MKSRKQMRNLLARSLFHPHKNYYFTSFTQKFFSQQTYFSNGITPSYHTYSYNMGAKKMTPTSEFSQKKTSNTNHNNDLISSLYILFASTCLIYLISDFEKKIKKLREKNEVEQPISKNVPN